MKKRIVAAGILGILLVASLLLVFDWPWWVGLFLLLLLAGLTLGCFFLGKLWLRRRGDILTDEAGARELAWAREASQLEKSRLDTLQQLWKTAIDTLRASHLNKLGNPLYVLPWYLLIGQSGSGKSSSLHDARLSSPMREADWPKEVSATEQCAWWFLEHEVIIDTAGRYAMPANESQDREEWRKLLSLLMKYRRKEPLNGLIVAVAADRLLEAGEARLVEDGCAIRRRLDELMRAAGVKVPVYLLVTKCDLIQGMDRFCQLLPTKCLDQAMGVVNREPSPDAAALAEHAMAATYERLRDLRLQLLHQPLFKEADPSLLLFPEEFKQLGQGLLTLVINAFGENPYQETPLLRGLFFGSARQHGAPHSHFFRCAAQEGAGEAGKSGDAGKTGEAGKSGEAGTSNQTRQCGQTGESGPELEPSEPGTGKGWFLHDFFARMLPDDRSLLAPTRRSLQWRSVTGNLGLVSWAVLGVALSGLLTFSFVKNMNTIREFSHGFARISPLRGDMRADLASLERFRQDILKVEEQNRHWWLPRFGLTESLKVEKGLKRKFCRQFQDMVLTPFDRRLTAGVAGISPNAPDEVCAGYAVHLARRINILKASIDGKDLGALQSKPQPAYLSVSSAAAAAGAPEAGKTFGALYLCALIWREDAAEVGKETAALQSLLKQLLAVKRGNLQWLAIWVDRQSGLPPVALKEFWGGSQSAPGERTVAPAFTRKGKESLNGLAKELEAALPDPSSLAAGKAGLEAWYRSAAFLAWRSFAEDFSKGEQRLRGPAEWQQTAARMASQQGPYFALLERIALELEPLALEAPLPGWLLQVYHFQGARAQGLVQDSAAINRAAEGGKKILTSIRKNVGQEAGARKLEKQLATSKACQEYCNALTAIAPAVASRTQIFQLSSQTFGEDPATGKSPFYAAASASARYRAALPGTSADPVFSRLLNGPLEFLWSYLLRETAVHLQSLWEEQVLAGITGMTSQQAIPALLGPEGLAWRFVKGPAAPFLSRGLSGYRAKEALRGKIPFESALFRFMEKGSKAQATVAALGKPQNYSVGVKGLPTDANAEASVKPQATRLELQCGGAGQSMVNYNYPVGKTFSWSPDACGDVLLQIEVGDVILARHYPGRQGFPDFLKDLRGGRRTFKAKEFPGEMGALRKIGVSTITVNYEFIGSGPILQQTAALSGQAPRSIARCWMR